MNALSDDVKRFCKFPGCNVRLTGRQKYWCSNRHRRRAAELRRMPPGPLMPGIHPGVPADRYHADPCRAPSLTASIAKVLCTRSPRHAWEAHPRLNPDHRPDAEQRFDVGTAAHAMLLQGDDICAVIDAQDWRTNAAKEARDAVRVTGRIPLLTDQHAEVTAMVAAVRAQLDASDADPPLLADGTPEQTIMWEEAGVTCRARLDWLRHDHAAIDDLKTTRGSAHPHEWTQRQMWSIGADIQAAFYLRGISALTRVEAEFRFIVAETQPPYAVSIISLAPSALELARDKVNWAISTWRDCLASGRWPGYPGRVAYAESPAYEEMRWAELRHFDTEVVPA